METITYFLAIILSFFVIGFTQAQLSGKVVKENLGMEFTIPDGWFGQETEEAIILGSNTIPGFVYITLNEYESMSAIAQEMALGLSDGGNTHMMPVGNPETIQSNILGSVFEGVLEGQSAKAYVISILNPEGYGVSMMAATEADKYSEDYRALARQIAQSFEFKKIETTGLVAQWKQRLTHMALNYISSYSSGGGSGGTSAQTKIDLCPNGSFSFRGSSFLSVDTGGAFGSSSSNDQGTGSWDIIGNRKGGASLVLNFSDGRVYEYELSINEQDQTFLNGRRYFVIGQNDPSGSGPNCF